MSGPPYNVILLPTLDCNVACDYCFEKKRPIRLTLEQVPRLAEALLDHMAERGSTTARIYWQGGEVLLMGAAWFERAYELFTQVAAERGLSFSHALQTNLIGWSSRWHGITREMFGGSIGTSMDFPNAHRRLRNGSTEAFTRLWRRAVEDAQAAGFGIGCIAVVHPATLEAGPEAFYEYFVDEVGLQDFQVNKPFPGGPSQGGATLAIEPLTRFLTGLMDVWVERGLGRGVALGPLDALVDRFSGRPSMLPCIWQPNCAGEFVSVDATGEVALCDCWVTSYPEHCFGNLFETSSLGAMLSGSPAHARFLERPERIMETEDCLSCPWLSMCHGGCPVRTFTAKGTLFAKDPYCEVYRALFAHARQVAGDVVKAHLAGSA